MTAALNRAQAPISTDAPEAELVARAVDGSEAAFEMIVRRHNQFLFRAARAIHKSDAEAEDVLQEAYVRAWRALDQFRADAPVAIPAWAWRAASSISGRAAKSMRAASPEPRQISSKWPPRPKPVTSVIA